MSEGPTGSTVPRRQLGRYLRDMRNRARLTVRAAAAALEWSEAKIWRIETGQTSMRSLDVEQVCRIYGATSEETETLMALAKETKAKGWWLSYSDVINEGFVAFLDSGRVAMRDSKDPEGPVLVFTAGEWAAFVNGVRGDEFARP
jgi:transcriptional regulator with XRE-family HTH domain